ncbi:MAG: DUF3567 family protein [Hydrogenophilales bacterium]|nr:DUF3567 family protein [Hydrogenophilales bacterium]
MNVVFNSPYYQVLEYPEINAFELVNHARSTGALIQGEMASVLRANLQNLFAVDPTEEAVDEMIGGYEALMNLPIRYH